MSIHILSEETINRIAAGEVVERPVNVAKELIENSIDAGANAITIEIRDGGTTMLRVTDNGCGIDPSDIRCAFHRHATSKIENEQDLMRLFTLGFRGEALSSIAAVAEVEMITKVRSQLTGIRARNDSVSALSDDGDVPLEISEIGAPDGTSVIVRNLFYNVPVRRKFLKSAQTEAGYITDLVEKMALSHPDISFHYRVNGNEKLHTTGSGDLREVVYRIYGREIASGLIPIEVSEGELKLTGYLGRPEISRASRSFEIFFVNGRLLRSDVLSKALEEGYRTDLMQHRFPFAILHLTIPADQIDVNVHPSKMEVRFSDPNRVYSFVDENVHGVLHRIELIPKETLLTAKEEAAAAREEKKQQEEAQKAEQHIEAFEQDRRPAAYSPEVPVSLLREPSDNNDFFEDRREPSKSKLRYEQASLFAETDSPFGIAASGTPDGHGIAADIVHHQILDQPEHFGTDPGEKDDLLFHIVTPEHAREYIIVGQIFDTYWILQFRDKMIMIDQHAAHEKVNFERIMKRLSVKNPEGMPSQMIAPPTVIQLTGREEGAYLQFQNVFADMGYEIEPLGGGTYAIRAVPMELYGNSPEALLRETLEEMIEEKIGGTPSAILYKIASMSCKAAVKGNMSMTRKELTALIDELLTLDNPYHCPHGRPTMVILSQKEIERKFKRIV